jgi:hypothetical protein
VAGVNAGAGTGAGDNQGLNGANCIQVSKRGDLGHPAGTLLHGCRMACMGRHVTKPQGYRQTAAEQLFCLFVVCLPYCQSLLFAGMSGIISFFLLTLLLMFVVARSPAIYRVITACLKVLPPSWVAPTLDRRDRWVGAPLYMVVSGPSLAPSFQRPPPRFS